MGSLLSGVTIDEKEIDEEEKKEEIMPADTLNKFDTMHADTANSTDMQFGIFDNIERYQTSKENIQATKIEETDLKEMIHDKKEED